MAYTFPPPFNFNDIQSGYLPRKGYEKEGIINRSKRVPTLETEDRGVIDSFRSTCGVDLKNRAEKTTHVFEDQQEIISQIWLQDHLHNGAVPLSDQSSFETTDIGRMQTPNIELCEPTKGRPPFPVASSKQELVSPIATGFKLVGDESLRTPSNNTTSSSRNLSTEDIMRKAGERYIQFSTQQVDGFVRSIHPYGSSLSSLSIEEIRDVELAHHLLAAAEEVCYKQFDFASRLLIRCESRASASGNPVERIVFYFAEALRERIDKETGISTIDYKRVHEQVRYISGLSSGANLAFLACHQELPFTQVMQFAGMQAILDNVTLATKVHLIDLHVRSGIQWTALLQALAERDNHRIETLRMTAIATSDKVKNEETGERLLSFAKSLNLPFSFKVLLVSDFKDLKEEQFDIEADEAVAVYSPTILRTMIPWPDLLENLMRVILKLKPSVMVVTEVEVNHNSPSFVNRFIEALFFYSTFFDCLDDCMDRDN
ncbi:hypothetical protein RJ639_033574 [Escallonia herrerae]|uniref:DELLA protein n=1 Tax=Escallonia herrerae TaxID=1293975 RepID=A0AA89B954_9ASTE|nr:hypothetical protein RJ639_033574 [Escallonia herrerae]